MNYQKIYDQLIARAKTNRNLLEYTEKHHVIPKSLGGDDSADNLVILTAREHFMAHLLLARILGGNMIHAAHMMSNMGRYSNRTYSSLRRQHADRMSELLTGRIVSENTKAALRLAHANKNKERVLLGIDHPLKGRIRSIEHSKNIGIAATGRVLSDEWRENISKATSGDKNPMYGKTHTEESRSIISEANKQKIVCPHCQKEGGGAQMISNHFNNCKFKEKSCNLQSF